MASHSNTLINVKFATKCVLFLNRAYNDIRDVEIGNVVDWIQHECPIVHIIIIIFAFKIVVRFQWST